MEKNTNTTATTKFNRTDRVVAAEAFEQDPAMARWVIHLGTPTKPTGFADILSFDDETAVGFAKYAQTGLLVRFVVTGSRSVSGGLVRVRLTAATDNGDADGTVNFDDAEYTVLGYTNFYRFANTKS